MSDLWKLDRQLSADLDISSDFDGIPDPMRGLVRDKVLVPATIDYEAAIREWEYYEQDVDPHENRTYEQMIRDVVDAAIGEDNE